MSPTIGEKIFVCGSNDYSQLTDQLPSFPCIQRITVLPRNQNSEGFYDSIHEMVCGAYYGIIMNGTEK